MNVKNSKKIVLLLAAAFLFVQTPVLKAATDSFESWYNEQKAILAQAESAEPAKGRIADLRFLIEHTRAFRNVFPNIQIDERRPATSTRFSVRDTDENFGFRHRARRYLSSA